MTEYNVVHNPDEKRFEVQLDNDNIAVTEYMQHGKNMVFTHTEVPEAYEGRGIAGKLAKTALNYAKDEGYKVQPLCPFIRSYVKRHPEYHEISWGF